MMRWQANQSRGNFAHVGRTLGNNDPLYDRKRTDSLQEKANKIGPIGRYAWILAVFAPVPALAQDASNPSNLADAFDSSTIIIAAERDACYRFDVYLATTREQQIRGLMHVRRMPEFSGMLFLYSEPAVRSMWMKNTYLPLDILFIREDGTISNIVADTEPLSLTSIASTEPVFFVLELNAGTAARLHIDSNSRVNL